MRINDVLKEFVTPQATAQDPGLEREKDVDIVFVGLYPQGENRAEDVATALEEVLPKEYPQAWHRPNYNGSNVRRVMETLRKNQIATVTTKPLSVAQKLVKIFQTYGIKCRIDAPGLEEDLTERNMGQPRVPAAKPEIISAVDNGKIITVQVRVPDGTTRSMSNSNPAVIQQWLNVKYGLRFPANIARKFVGMPASMAEQDIDEDLSRRGFLKGAGAAALAGAAGSTLGQAIHLHDKPGNVLPKSFGHPSQREELQAKFDSMPLGQKINWRVKPNIVYTGNMYVDNPAEVEVSCAADGKIISVRLLKSSQNKEWDNAVLKAVNKSEYMPSDENGKIQPLIVISFDPGLEQKLRENLQRMQQAAGATGPAKESVEQGVTEGDLNEKSTSQAQFRTMAAAAHNPKFARKVGIATDVAQEFHGADRGQDYKSLPKKANEGELDEGELDEGWKEKVAAAALAGTMALGSAGAQARITPDAQGNFPSSGKPVATQQATTTAPAIPSTLTKPQAQYDVDTQLLTYKGKQYKWNSDAQATGQGEVVSAPAMSIRSRSMFPTKVELNPNGTYTRASVNEAAPRLPNPQNYDSDWDYYNDRDSEEPADDDADYENMIDEPNDWFDESRQKVGNMDADAFDAALSRMKKLAGAGPLKTVYDPNKRVYKNMPTAQQPAKQPQK